MFSPMKSKVPESITNKHTEELKDNVSLEMIIVIKKTTAEPIMTFGESFNLINGFATDVLIQKKRWKQL